MVSGVGDKSENILVEKVDIVEKFLTQAFGEINGVNILLDIFHLGAQDHPIPVCTISFASIYVAK